MPGEASAPRIGPGRPSAGSSQYIADRILAAAWILLLETGPEGFTIERLATAAQASKQTIYARFPGKAGLLQALLAARVEPILLEMRHFVLDHDAQSAFADYASRTIRSMVEPTSRMLDRLVDWIDTQLPGTTAAATRSGMYSQLQRIIAGQLERAAEHWGLRFEDASDAAAFWLEAIVGHVRAMQSYELQKDEWPALFARYYLRAVSVPA